MSITEALQDSIQIVLTRKNKSGSIQDTFNNIPHTDEIKEVKKDKEGKPVEDGNGNFVYQNRAIRYVPGESSIYIDEQAKDARGQNIIIHGAGVLISSSEVNKMEYIKKCNYNGSNPNRRTDKTIIFREFDRESEFKKHLDKADLIIQAKSIARGMDAMELKSFIMVLSKDPRRIDELNRKPISELRHIAYNMCDKDPKQWVDGIQSTDARMKLSVMRAIGSYVVKLDKKDNSLSWENTGEEILRAPHGMDVINYFIERAKNDANFAEMLDIMKSKTQGANNRSTELPSPKLDIYDTLIETAIEKEIISRNGVWLYFGENKFKGPKAMREALKADGMKMFTEVTLAIENASTEE